MQWPGKTSVSNNNLTAAIGCGFYFINEIPNPECAILPYLAGATACGIALGRCAEFRAANELLLTNPGLKLKDIQFTPAIRPRTREVVPRCENCKIYLVLNNDIYG